MSESSHFEKAVGRLKALWARLKAGDKGVLDIQSIIVAQNEVVLRYQEIFAQKNLPHLAEEDFREFLHFKNNKHWMALQRMGPSVCADMERLRSALEILLDESRPIHDRLNELVPQSGPAYVPRLSKAILTPILLICYPDKYGVWNQVSEGAMKALEIWPPLDRGTAFGNRYERINDVLTRIADAVGVDLWVLDGLWWRYEKLLVNGEEESQEIEPGTQGESTRFGLERHLHEFLRDNWAQTKLGRDWAIYEEDGDPDAGYEYPCKVGRIDLLARHRKEPRWLVIELKRNQSSDQTVGQLLRYMGWVKQHLAGDGEKVEGLVIAHQADDSIRYALAVAPDVELQLYEVDFRLRKTNVSPEGQT